MYYNLLIIGPYPRFTCSPGLEVSRMFCRCCRRLYCFLRNQACRLWHLHRSDSRSRTGTIGTNPNVHHYTISLSFSQALRSLYTEGFLVTPFKPTSRCLLEARVVCNVYIAVCFYIRALNVIPSAAFYSKYGPFAPEGAAFASSVWKTKPQSN